MAMTSSCGLTIDTPATPGYTTPNKTFYRQVFMDGQKTINGQNIKIWGFKDASGGTPFPSPAIRVNQGDITHVTLDVSMMMAHTIHLHGIEPSQFNDGVGHTSFDVQGGQYTYQFRPAYAGSYFYHCHTNTVLHGEMGMYGVLIVDPPSGPGTAWNGGPAYDVEKIWAVDDIDPVWHNLAWDAGLCGADVGLNKFNPKYFIINGVGSDKTPTDTNIIFTVTKGKRALLRYVQAGYVPQRIKFTNPSGLGGLKVIAEDGRPLATAETLPVSNSVASRVCVSAERLDFYFTPTTVGIYKVEFEFLHWITGAVLGTVYSYIKVV